MSVIERAYFSGGCFWCTEAIYKRLNGVLGVKPGFSGGNIKNPSYKEVCTGRTGHAETVEVVYDSSQIDFQLLLEDNHEIHCIMGVFFCNSNQELGGQVSRQASRAYMKRLEGASSLNNI